MFEVRAARAMLHETPMSTMGAMSRYLCVFLRRALRAVPSFMNTSNWWNPTLTRLPRRRPSQQQRSITSSARQIISSPTTGSLIVNLDFKASYFHAIRKCIFRKTSVARNISQMHSFEARAHDNIHNETHFQLSILKIPYGA